MKKVILQGFLAEEFGRDWEIKANSYAEIFSCIDANYPQFRPRLIEYYQQGGDLSIQTGEELLKEIEVEDLINPPEFDTIYITPVPTGSKSGGAKILAAVAIVGLMFIPGVNAAVLSGLGTLAAGGFSLTGLAALTAISLAVNLAMTGLQQLLAPDPSVDENDQDYLFSGPQDVVASGNPVPVLVGEMIIGGIVMSAGVIPGLPGAAGHIGGYPAGSGGFIDLAGGLSGGAGGSVDEFLWDNSYVLSGALDEPQKDYILYSENTITKPWTARPIPTGVSYISPVTPHDIPNDLWATHNASVNLYQHSPDIDWSNFQDEIVGSIPTQATLFRTLSGPTLNAEVDFGSNNVTASLNATLDNIALESEVSLDSEFILNANLDDISFSSVGSFTGLSEIAASLQVTLDDIAFTATSSADFIATLTGTLDPIGFSGEAANEFIASLAGNLEEVAFVSTATAEAGGPELDAFTIAAWNPDSGANSSGEIVNVLGTGNLSTNPSTPNWTGESGDVSIYLNPTDSTSLITGAARTITFWHLRRSTYPNYTDIISYYNTFPASGDPGQWSYRFTTEASPETFDVYITGANARSGDLDFLADTWYFHTVVIGANSWAWYRGLDELLQLSWLPSANSSNGASLVLGGLGAYGRYADIRVHNKVLTTLERETLFTQGRQSY